MYLGNNTSKTYWRVGRSDREKRKDCATSWMPRRLRYCSRWQPRYSPLHRPRPPRYRLSSLVYPAEMQLQFQKTRVIKQRTLRVHTAPSLSIVSQLRGRKCTRCTCNRTHSSINADQPENYSRASIFHFIFYNGISNR